MSYKRRMSFSSSSVLSVLINNSGVLALAATDQTASLLIPIEFVDKDKKVLPSVRVAKMCDEGVLTGSGISTVLNIDKDSDIFFVQLPGCANYGTGIIRVGTDNPDASYNEKGGVVTEGYPPREAELDLQIEGKDLVSKAIVLVSNTKDDEYEVDGIQDNQRNDRTFKIQLGGKFQVTSIKLGTTEIQDHADIPVKVEKIARVSIVSLKYYKGPALLLTCSVDDINKDMKFVQERYAQVGIQLKWSISIQDSPNGVDLWDGGMQVSQPNHVANEQRALFDALATPNPDDITLFYVNNFGDEFNTYGQAIIPKFFFSFSDIKYTNNLIVAAESAAPVYTTITHELGHLLTNNGHVDTPFNIMNPYSDIDNSIYASKRFTREQQEAMFLNTALVH